MLWSKTSSTGTRESAQASTEAKGSCFSAVCCTSIATGLVTAYTLSAWPDLIVGLAIAAVNAGAAWEVWRAAREERQEQRHSGGVVGLNSCFGTRFIAARRPKSAALM